MPTRLKAVPVGGEVCPAGAETKARGVIEARIGRPLSDEEWRGFRASLLAFGTILRTWDQKRLEPAELGNV